MEAHLRDEEQFDMRHIPPIAHRGGGHHSAQKDAGGRDMPVVSGNVHEVERGSSDEQPHTH